jgi:hypothetical protein
MPADKEARELLRDARQAQLIPEMRLELLFYGVVYGAAGFEDGPAEIKSLLDSGVRIPAIWDVSREAAMAKERGHPQADLLKQVALH